MSKLRVLIATAISVLNLLATSPIYAWDPAQFEPKPYWKLILDALLLNDLNGAESLTNNPPLSNKTPLADADGRFLYVAAQALAAQQHPPEAEKMFKMIERFLELGASPLRFVPTRENPEQEPTEEPRFTAIDGTINAWASAKKQSAKANIRKLFDLYYQTGALPLTYGALFNPPNGKPLRFPLSHWALGLGAHEDMVTYFLRKIPADVADASGITVAGMAAAQSDIKFLEQISAALGPARTAESFNTISPARYAPTNMHIAIHTISNRGRTVQQVLEVLEYLVAHGADPDKRSVFHDLLQECDYAGDIHPKSETQYAQLKEIIAARLPKWRAKYREISLQLVERRCEDLAAKAESPPPNRILK